MKAKILPDGLQGQAVNPFNQYGDAMATDFMEFEANNPPRPLTIPLPDRVGEVVEVEEVWQYKKPRGEWITNEDGTHDYDVEFGLKTRMAYKIIGCALGICNICDYPLSPKVEGDKNVCHCNGRNMPPKSITTPEAKAIEESVEEAAMAQCFHARQRDNDKVYNAFIRGANWQKQQSTSEIELEINRLQWYEEEVEAIHKWLDKQGAPTHNDNNKLSIVGRFTKLNGDVVKMVEGRIAYLQTFPESSVQVELNEAYMFLNQLTKNLPPCP